MRLLLLFAVACTPGVPDVLVAVDGFAGEYTLVEVELPELEDPYRMRGTLGDGRAGGYLRQPEADALEYTGGGSLAVDYVVDAGIGVPLDADGIALWSYYNTLARTRVQLDELGENVDHLFPIPFAFQPSVGGASAITSNAAYVSGGAHLFALLADPVGARLPLAANPMVIRHEFGHAVFQDIVGGGKFVYAPDVFLDPRLSALNEGFADMLASLLLDDPDPLGASFAPEVATARRVDGGAEESTLAPPVDARYERGTVHASFAWDLREIEGDRTIVLQDVLRALRRFGEDRPWLLDDDDATVDAYALYLLDAYLEHVPLLDARRTQACVAYTQRFTAYPEPSACSSLL